ncbi:MAG: hypothetical protein AAGF89_14940 [Bacteroidota bacterium]
MLAIGVVGVLGIQIGLYELIKGQAPLMMVYSMLGLGSALALVGFDYYRRVEDSRG